MVAIAGTAVDAFCWPTASVVDKFMISNNLDVLDSSGLK
jgi:hypothetical protein